MSANNNKEEPEIRCPYCHARIHKLIGVQRATHYYDVQDQDGELQYEEQDIEFGGDFDMEYECPECSEVIAYGEDEALEFLETGHISDEGDKALAEQAQQE